MPAIKTTKSLCKVQSRNLDKIATDKNYGSLMYRVGMLYMFNYKDENGANSTANNAKMAAEWFKRAIDAVDAETAEDDRFYSVAKAYWHTLTESRAWQKVSVTALDTAGNAAETVEAEALVSTNIFVRWFNNTPVFIGSLVGVAAAAIIIVLVVKRKKSNED